MVILLMPSCYLIYPCLGSHWHNNPVADRELGNLRSTSMPSLTMGNKDTILLALLMGFALTLAPTQASRTCPANMHFNNCGTACPMTCHRRGKFFPCTRQCVPRCVCNDRYILNDSSSDRCIPEDQC
ncbi:mucin-5B-like [Pleurodeles waltl]|uniref:mucin-5B-like n=1 Tax=Pleurodeles waltl TaxID=8319 RepID=UPI0037098D37